MTKIPEEIKREVKSKCDKFVETVLKPVYIKSPPENNDWNYLVDIYTKWYRNYYYFYGKYHSPSPRAIAPYFEMGFARLEYVSQDNYNLSYMRHTGQWWEIHMDLSLAQCLKTIKDEPHFMP